MGHYDESRVKPALEKAQVLLNEEVAPGVWHMEVTAPLTSSCCKGGQFIELRVPGNAAELLRLPFGIYGTIPEMGAIELLYQVVGEGTKRMTKLGLGDTCDLIGPLGNGFNPPADAKRALLVLGGLGTAPLWQLALALHEQGVETDICMGAPTAKRLVGRDRFETCGNVFVSTDDGSEGLHGFVTQISAELLEKNTYDYIATCGPGPMEKIVAAQAKEAGVFCEVSLERLMACGIGACLSCVVDTTSGKQRVCADGPVFDATEVIW